MDTTSNIYSGTMTDGSPADMTVRVTDVYRKIDGKWLIAQEQCVGAD